MEEFDSIENLADAIKNKLDSNTEKKKILALYAFNTTGKTRLSNLIFEDEDDNEGRKVLRYNSFFEDIFTWDNDEYALKFKDNSWIIELVVEQGLDTDIVKNFKNITRSNIEPSFDFSKKTILFNIVSGDDASATNIKISRGEESIFIWSVFYTVLETVIAILNDKTEDRTTDRFDSLEYIIIDDPVSSMDDSRIISVALALLESISSLQDNSVKFLLTTHHALFFNVLVNYFKRDRKRRYNFKSYNLLKYGGSFELSKEEDSPFSYHLYVKKIIRNAITKNDIEKYHFNLFRNLLEKTANFLGYRNWEKCVPDDNKKEFIKLLNLYSHSKLADLEARSLSGSDKEIFEQTFDAFNKKYFQHVQ